MSTGTDIIKAALQEIGVHSVASPANPEAIETGRLKLNSMLEEWTTEGILLGVTPLEVPGNDVNEPADAYSAIVSNLAQRLAPDFNRPVNPETLRMGLKGYKHVKKFYQPVNIPKKVPSSTLPRGQGTEHREWRYWSPFFGPNTGLDK